MIVKQKYKLSYLFFILFLIPLLFIFSGCTPTETEIVSIVSIEKTSTEGLVDTYTIKYTNGTTSTFTVTNGEDGVDGINGKDGVDGKNGVDGKDGVDGVDGKDGVDGVDGKDGLNGQDGNVLSVLDIYNAAVLNGYQGTFFDFCKQFLEEDESNNSTVAVGKAVSSCVSIFTYYTDSSGSAYGGAGSGVIYDINKETGDAYVITNYHVIYDADCSTEDKICDDIRLYLYGMEYTYYTIPAEFIGGSMQYDIALLKVTGSYILENSFAKVATIKDSNTVNLGDSIYVVGNAKGMGMAATSGIISLDSQHVSFTAANEVSTITSRVFRTDAAVNGGNSGGGLFDDNGDLIGIVVGKSSDADNIGYVIPSNVAIGVIENLLYNYNEQGVSTVNKFQFGVLVGLEEIGGYEAEDGSIKLSEVVVFDTVYEDTASAKAGAQSGDIVKQIIIDGTTYDITREYMVFDLTWKVTPDSTLVVVVERNGEDLQLTYTISASNFVEIV